MTAFAPDQPPPAPEAPTPEAAPLPPPPPPDATPHDGVPAPEAAAGTPPPTAGAEDPSAPAAIAEGPADVLEAPPPTPPADPFHVESVVAAIGIGPFLDGSLRRVHLHHLARAAKVGDEIDRKLYLFINRAEPAPSAALPEFDFDAARTAVDDYTPSTSEYADPQSLADLIGAFGELHEVGMAAIPVIDRIREYLWGKVPRRQRMTLAGPVPYPPAHSDLARWRRLWTIANDPLGILDDLNEYALSRGMVEAVATLYPLIWKRMQDGITTQLARKKAAAPGWTLSVRKDYLLRILDRNETPESLAVGVALQALFAQEAAEQAPKPVAPKRKGVAQGGSTESSAADRIGTT